MPLWDLDRESSSRLSATEESDIDIDVEDRDTSVDDEAEDKGTDESDPDELDVACREGLRWCCGAT